MANVTDRIQALGLVLPEPIPPAGAYSPVVVDGDLAFTSGLVAVGPNGIEHAGRLGEGVGLEDGQRAARSACLLTLGTLAAAIGGLERVARVLKLTGYVRCAPHFDRLPAVLDGASNLLIELFDEAGRAARSTVGVAALPFGASVELDTVVRLTLGP